jgi:DNA polymerase-3 subunit gamma/tau
VSYSGKKVTYRDVIENLNVLDYEYYFKTVDGAIRGDVPSALMTFNEVLEKGFDGHNFISGLNSHLRDLLVARDEVTLRLLEATPSIRQRYLDQTRACTEDFLLKALDAGSNCDISYKTSKNPRLHVELLLIKLCRMQDSSGVSAEKKKSDIIPADASDKDIPIPSKSEILREPDEDPSSLKRAEGLGEGHAPVNEKVKRSFSIKEIISDEKRAVESDSRNSVAQPEAASSGVPEEFNTENFEKAWADFTSQLKGEGPRIISMFRSIRTETGNDQIIKIHLSNAAQKDLFVQN